MKWYDEKQDVYCLNKGWKFIEQDLPYLPESRNHDDVYAFAKGGGAYGPAAAYYNDTDWEEVTLPHDWVTHHPYEEQAIASHGYKRRGTGWYRLRFHLEEADAGRQMLLEFEGMSAEARIFVNGMLLKRNTSGYNSFAVDISDVVHYGEIPNTLAIQIQALSWEGWWYEGAGIYRNVWLVKKAPLHIAYQGVYVCPKKLPEECWELQIETTLENCSGGLLAGTLSHQILDSRGDKVAEICLKEPIAVESYSTTKNLCKLKMENPRLWSPESPVLYHIRTSVICGEQEGTVGEEDVTQQAFGFRTMEWNPDTGFWLNGQHVKLKGFCNHQDHAGLGVAVPYNIKEWRVRQLKELGANACRLAHNPDPEMLAICDQLGMLVMEENRTFNSMEANLNEVRGIVRNARNHPSVILYSVFNEEPLQGTDVGRRVAATLRAAVREEDDTRPVTGAFNGGYMEEEGAVSSLDVVGINYNPGRYDDFHQKYPQIPLLGSETVSSFMMRGEYRTDREKHRIADLDEDAAYWGNTHREAWQYVAERPFVAGTFVWTGFDYLGEPTPYTWPSKSSFFGVLDSCGFPKNAAYLYRAFWTREPMIHIASAWAEKAAQGQHIPVRVYTNCEEAAVYVNDRLVCRERVNPYQQMSLELDCEEGVLRVEGYEQGNLVVSEEIRGAEEASSLRVEPQQAQLSADGHEAAIINIALLDSRGTIVPDQDRRLDFVVERGVILGVGNGDPNAHEPDVASYRRTFHGRAQVLVRPLGDGQKDTLKVVVSGEGLPSQTVEIPVLPEEAIPDLLSVTEEILDGWKLYYQLFDQMPDVHLQTDANDMNSFEPVSFSGHPQPELAEQMGKYAMYRTVCDMGKREGTYQLYFCHVEGYAWIYLDGTKIGERTDSYGGALRVPLPEEMVGEHEVTVIIQNANPIYHHAGICGQVNITKM